MADYRPDVLDSFCDLVATGGVEVLGETYYHSLASLYSPPEFQRQIGLHRAKVREVFGVEPKVFRNTELIYSNRIATEVESLGFRGVLAEGVPWIHPLSQVNSLAKAPGTKSVKTLLRNSFLSDDLHQGRDSGSFRFWEEFVSMYLERGGEFVTPSMAVTRFEVESDYDCSHPTSWIDSERERSAWVGNAMQKEATLKIHGIEQAVMETGDPRLIHSWSKLQCSDHFHYMSSKVGSDGLVPRYSSPFETSYDAYIYFMNALADLQIRVDRINLARSFVV